MRILLCPSAFYPSLGGVEEICRNLGRELQAKGFDIKVAVNHHPQTLPQQETFDQLPVHRFAWQYPSRSLEGIATMSRIPASINEFVNFVRDFNPDLVHVICPSSTALYCTALKNALGTKLLVTLQGEFFMDASQLYQKSAFARYWAGKLLESADAVTACSQYVLDDAKQRFRFQAGVEKVIFNGVDLGEPAQWSGGNLPNRQFILGVGRLVHNKGFEWLLKSFKLLSQCDPSVDLVLAGDGPMRPQLEQLAGALGIEQRVHFVGRQDRAAITHLFQQCMFFVMPSHLEPFGIVCLEAMRAGKPVIAANAGGPREFISDNGMLVPAGDEAALFSAMKQLCENADSIEMLGAKGKHEVQRFEWTKITNQYVAVYQSLKDGAANRLAKVR